MAYSIGRRLVLCRRAFLARSYSFDVKDSVSDFYGSLFAGNDDDDERPVDKLQTSCCTLQSHPEYSRLLRDFVHPDLHNVNFGCGSPIPPVSSLPGLRVLDLGSGSGRDCFVLSALVGESGSVLGVDMTDEALELSRSLIDYHAEKNGYENVEFRRGDIEDLKTTTQVPDNSIDLVVSNCVINLASDKESVFREISRVLRPGGELYFSDIYASARLPQSVRENELLWGECVAGALYLRDFDAIVRACGFPAGFAIVEGRQIGLDDELAGVFENDSAAPVLPEFFSLTTRLIALSEDNAANAEIMLDFGEENYGQLATYLGPEDRFVFGVGMEDFVKGEAVPVSRNVAAVLEASRYLFDVSAEVGHFGPFGSSSCNCDGDVLWGQIESIQSGCC